jgi:SAM-dependent methyltransferase
VSVSLAAPAPGHQVELSLLEQLRPRGWERILFIESGDGWVAEEAWRRMAKGYVCGVDRSPQRVARAARLRGVPGRLEFKTWDGRRVPAPDACFDSVILLHDGGDLEAVGVLREMCRVVCAGGEVVIVDADGSSEWPHLFAQSGLVLQGGQRAHPLRARKAASPPRSLAATSCGPGDETRRE